MTKALVLVDVSNIYHSLQNKFGGRFDYMQFLEYLKADELQVYRAIAYGAQFNGEATTFIDFLKRAGYEVRFKSVKQFNDGTRKGNLDIEIAMDAVKILESVDVVVLVSADGDFVSLIEYIQSRGKRCFVFGCNISRDLANIADRSHELSEDCLVVEP